MQTIKPSKDQIFAKPDEVVTKTKSGLYISEQAAEKPQTANVINVGESVTQYEPNDKIIYKSYAMTDVKLNNEDFIIIAEEDVLGKVVET